MLWVSFLAEVLAVVAAAVRVAAEGVEAVAVAVAVAEVEVEVEVAERDLPYVRLARSRVRVSLLAPLAWLSALDGSDTDQKYSTVYDRYRTYTV